MLKPRYLIALAFVVVGLAGGATLLSLAARDRAPQHATVLPVAQPLPEFALTDHRGAALGRGALEGAWHLLFFGFTNCPDICPATLTQLSAARRQLAAEGRAPLPSILLISVDPERDSPPVLAEYVGRFGAGVSGATGHLADIKALAAAVGIHVGDAPHHGGAEYDVNHSSAVLVVDPDVRLVALFSAPHSVAAFTHDLPLIVDGP